MKKPGCYNRPPMAEQLVVQDGYHEYEAQGVPVRRAKYKYVPHAMTTDCQWSKANDAAICIGCIHKQPVKEN